MKSTTFSVMTFNVRFGLADDGANAWRHRRKILPRLFDRYPADFIGFQEVNAFQIQDLYTMLKGYAAIGQRSPAPSFWQNNMIFHKQNWELLERQHFFLSPTPAIPSRARDSRWPRQCTMGFFQKNSFNLICIDTHLDFESSTQKKSAQLILNHLSQWPTHIPAVLVGDFNASPDSELFSMFTGPRQKSSPHCVTFKSALSKPYEGTHHGFSGRAEGDAIDWILYTDGLILENCRIIKDHVDGSYYSDHFPVIATFSW